MLVAGNRDTQVTQLSRNVPREKSRNTLLFVHNPPCFFRIALDCTVWLVCQCCEVKKKLREISKIEELQEQGEKVEQTQLAKAQRKELRVPG